MKLFKKIKSSFPFFLKNNIRIPVTTLEISMSERENKVYDPDKLTLQKLYEKWSCKDKWLLHDEGIPLLFGIEPGARATLDDESSIKIKELWVHAQDCVQKKLLSVVNTEKPEVEWQVRPIDLYCWATVSRISMPAEFSTLMTFVAQTVKSTDVNPTHDQNDGAQDIQYQRHREIVLGAATSLLVNAPELCKNDKGCVVCSQITRQINENKNQWFGDEKPLLTESAMADLINGYLKLTNPVV
jgi:hypothetical protein